MLFKKNIMKNSTHNYLLAMVMFVYFIGMSGCVFNINSDLDCLECSYRHDGLRISEERCQPTFNESEKAEMRVRLQAEADSLDVVLTCVER